MLFGSCKDENYMCRRFFQCFEKSIESSLREHMYLVDDEDFVFSHLRRYSCLIHKTLDMLHSVDACSIKLENIKRPLLGKRFTTLTLATGIAVGLWICTINDLSKNTRTCGLTHTTRPTEEISVCKLSACHSILQRSSERLLSHDSIE